VENAEMHDTWYDGPCGVQHTIDSAMILANGFSGDTAEHAGTLFAQMAF
jgi:hypothetical protein